MPDLDFVIASEQAGENSPFINVWTREQHESSLSNKDGTHLIVERCGDNKPVGFVILAGLKQL